jgi:small subunit ribosomal protein S20
MAITKSAKRAYRGSLTKKIYNDRRRRVMKENVRSVKENVKAKNKSEAAKNLKDAYKAIDKAAKRGVIKKGAANRKKSRLAKAIAKIA